MKWEVISMFFCGYKVLLWAKNSSPGDSSRNIYSKILLRVTST